MPHATPMRVAAIALPFVHTVRSLSPAVRIGICVALVLLAAGAAIVLARLARWRGAGELNAVQRVAWNSAAPIAAQLLNKVVDLAFALIVLRALGVSGTGEYDLAVLVWMYTKTFTDFGLGVLATRDVAQDRALAGRYLGLTTLLRLGLWVAALPLVATYTAASWTWLGLSANTALAIVFLLASIVPDSYGDAANAICNAFERMAGPAALTVLKNVIKVAVGLAALAAGWGVVGLAATALVTNVATAGLFAILLRRLGVRAVWQRPGREARGFLVEAWPLLLNNLLQNLFFRADVFVLQPTHGDREVGLYTAPYRFLNLLGLVPAYFTLALFPHLSRLAAARGEALAATYALAVKLLLIVALPVVLATMFLAPDLMGILGGSAFLPGAAIALRLLIWFLPFSYVNGITQYVLIAAGRQRLITRAFALTAGFNLAANLAFTPRYGYPAAAVITVLSELVLMTPFLVYTRRYIGPLPAPGMILRPLLAAAAMALAAWPVYARLRDLTPAAPWAAVAFGGAVYLVALVGARGIGATERRLALRLLGRST